MQNSFSGQMSEKEFLFFSKKLFDILFRFIYIRFVIGGIAQLGERLNGIQKVSGSIPLTSTSFLASFGRFLIKKRGYSSVGRATGSQSVGQRFDPA